MQEERNLREPVLTRNQRLVLSALETSQMPMSAYRILAVLQDQGLKAPAQIYRALSRLMALGRVHRIESLNAFMASRNSGQGATNPDMSAFLICQSCGVVSEVSEFCNPAIEATIGGRLRAGGFTMRSTKVEMWGLCRNCQAGSPS